MYTPQQVYKLGSATATYIHLAYGKCCWTSRRSYHFNPCFAAAAFHLRVSMLQREELFEHRQIQNWKSLKQQWMDRLYVYINTECFYLRLTQTENWSGVSSDWIELRLTLLTTNYLLSAHTFLSWNLCFLRNISAIFPHQNRWWLRGETMQWDAWRYCLVVLSYMHLILRYCKFIMQRLDATMCHSWTTYGLQMYFQKKFSFLALDFKTIKSTQSY